MSERPAPRGSRTVRLASWLAPLADTLVATTMLRGVAAGSDRPLTMLVAGPLIRVRWLVDRAFEVTPQHEALGHVPAWRLPRTLKRMRGSADLVVARVARQSAARLGFDDDWLPVPEWIGMRLEAPFDLDVIARRNHSVGDDIRRIRRDWTAEESHDPGDLAAFYRCMYVPLIRRRHRGDAYLRSMRWMRRAFRRGGLLWARCDGERRAAVLFERRRETLVAIAVGIAGGDESWMRAGAIASLYANTIELGRTSGAHAIDWGGSRPSPADGLTHFKRKWGMAVYDRPQVLHTTLVHWNRMSPAVLTFLEHTPLVFHDVDGLAVLGVARGHASWDAAQASARLDMPGLRRVVVLASSPLASDPGHRRNCIPVPVSAVDAGPRALRAATRASVEALANG